MATFNMPTAGNWNQSNRLPTVNALIALLLVWFVFIFTDLFGRWNGYELGIFLGKNILDLIVVVAVPLIPIIFIWRGGWDRVATARLVAGIVFAIFYTVSVTDMHSRLHFLVPIAFYMLFRSYAGDEVSFTYQLVLLTVIDFVGMAVFSALPADLNINRLYIPVWLIYASAFCAQHNQAKFFSWHATGILIFIVLRAIFLGGLIDYRVYANPELLAAGETKSFLTDAKMIGEMLNPFNWATAAYIWWNDTITKINEPYQPDNPREVEDPQGVYLEPVVQDYIFLEGSPVYAWALLEARNLDRADAIEGTITCFTETEYEGETVEIMADEVTPSTITVLPAVERSLYCKLPNLEAGQYDVTFRVEFNFQADAERRIYLMDRQRMQDDYLKLNREGIQPSPTAVLEYYGYTDTDPELKYNTGAIRLGLGTETVPWDVGDDTQANPQHKFGVSIYNAWKDGGLVKQIDNVYFKIPDDIEFDPDDCDANTPMIPDNSGPEAEAGYNVYKLNTVELESREGFLTDIEDQRTFTCWVRPTRSSLDGSPVTTRYFKVHVDYHYILEEGVVVEVEELETDEAIEELQGRSGVCCETYYPTQSAYSYAVTPTANECYSSGREIGRLVDYDYCENICCKIIPMDEEMGPGEPYYELIPPSESCSQFNSGFTSASEEPHKSLC